MHGGGCHVYLTFSLLWREYGFLELVQAGYDVFAISYRNDVFNTPSYTPPQWGPSKCGTEEIEDIFAARRHVDLLYPNTPKFLYGYSQGGYLVNLATTLYGDQYHWNGIISAAGMWDLKLTGVEPYFIAGHYDVERNPIAYLNKLNSPILLLHGQADSNVGFEHAQRFLAEAERLGIKVESYLPEQEEHHIENATRWNTWMTLFIDFLDRHSGG